MAEFLSVDAILAAPDVTEETVDVPEWGGKVKVRSLTKAEQIRVRKASVKSNGDVDEAEMEMRLFLSGVVEPKFSEHHAADLFEKSAGPVDRVLNAILQISGMGDVAPVKAAEKDLKS